MSADAVYLVLGLAMLVGVVLPAALRRAPLSAPIVLVAVGALIGYLPMPDGAAVSPVVHRALTEHLTEFCVIVALMGVGLALDRPLQPRSWSSWRRWGATWRLLAIGMPIAIAVGAVLGWWIMGLAPAGALLLGSVLAPTDPVLAADVQVEGPQGAADVEEGEEIDESDEVRFALTSEAGLNDGLAFPFVSAAILLGTAGAVGGWGWRWLGWELVGKTILGAVAGAAIGWLLARIAFRAPRASLRLAEAGEPLLALAATLLAYGLTQVIGGWGFLAVFTCGMAMRSSERGHEYHAHMHEVIARLERLLTLLVLLLLGVALTDGLLANLTWQGALVAVLLVAVVRPVNALVALGRGARRDLRGDGRLGPRERLVTAFFGVRGVGSLYYLSYATGRVHLPEVRVLWSTVAFTIVLSVLAHGVAATPAMAWLERMRRPGAPNPA